MIPIDSYLLKRSIEHYGKDVQSTVCMEECAELIQAISKEKRGNSDKDHLAEEMADVIICIEMLKEIYSISDDMISEWMQIKEARIIERIKKDVQSTETNAERIRKMTDDVCEWKYNDSEYYFESSCDHLHIFMSDGPKENEYGFCPYCGKKIKVVDK